jgi:hypothetical protein
MRTVILLAALTVVSLSVVPHSVAAQEYTPTPEWKSFKSTKTRAQVKAETEQAKGGAPKPVDDKAAKPADPPKK